MSYEKVGVYMLCRLLPGVEPDISRMHFKNQIDFTHKMHRGKATIYSDEVPYGERSERKELDRLIEDAMLGAIDHIMVADVADLWHSPQKILDTILQLNCLEKPVKFTCYFPESPQFQENYMPGESQDDRLMRKALLVKHMDDEFQLIANNPDSLSKTMRANILARHVDPYMFGNILMDNYMEPKHIDAEELAQQLGIDATTFDEIVDHWHPTDEKFDVLVELLWKEILAYYLA